MKWFTILLLTVLLGSTASAAEQQRPIKYAYQTKPWVALTFDDGPDPTITKEIVNVLEKHHERATFFFVGARALKFPDTARLVITHGHEIANHSYTHPNMSRMSEEAIYDEIVQAEDAFEQIVGKRSPWFRAPSGIFNERVRHAANRANVQVIGWYEDTRDWSSISTSQIVDNAVNKLQPGHIILFHDCCGSHRKKTVKALDETLTEIERRGYRCVTLSELLAKKP